MGDFLFRNRCLILFLAMSICCTAQTRRDDEPYCDEPSKRVDITDADATIIGLTIGHSSLDDVQAKLGRAQVARVSREEESDVSICYVSAIDRTILVFYSGAMGGWKDITSFALWSREAVFPSASQCALSTLVSQNIATDSGLRLGLTKEELQEKAGPTTKSSLSSTRYNYFCRRKMTPGEIKGFKDTNNWDVRRDPYFDRMSWIELHYVKSASSRIEVGRIESY